MKTNIHPKEIYQRVEEIGLTNSASMLTEIIEADKDPKKRQAAIKFLSLIDKIGGALLGVIRGFIMSSLIFIILAMFPAAGNVWQKKGNLEVSRNIYLIVPKIYEYLVDTLSSDSYFDRRIFLNTYGGFLKEETRS